MSNTVKITKIVSVNPKIEFSIDYLNTFGNKEALLIPVQGIKEEDLPKSENDDLLKKIQFYIFQGAIKKVTEDIIKPAKAKSDNPFASMTAVDSKKETATTKAVEKEPSKSINNFPMKDDSIEADKKETKSNINTATSTAKK